MGWIHTDAAGRTMDRIEAACKATREGTGETSSNVFVVGEMRYFYEIARRDQKDCGIAGTIHLCWTEEGGREMARQTATFRIDGHGRVVRGPKLFRDAVAALDMRPVLTGSMRLLGVPN